ncbi:hypothetical protein HU200_017925 [Digitaria exilis]|uniref:Uncharacterized protein n=1 Tax=Digitaria exilis TaxID=1010633 RepID=A0A835KET2_9POAL|nr:hypothetical protein HU200_017925 [Digitaria exilis]
MTRSMGQAIAGHVLLSPPTQLHRKVATYLPLFLFWNVPLKGSPSPTTKRFFDPACAELANSTDAFGASWPAPLVPGNPTTTPPASPLKPATTTVECGATVGESPPVDPRRRLTLKLAITPTISYHFLSPTSSAPSGIRFSSSAGVVCHREMHAAKHNQTNPQGREGARPSQQQKACF